MQLKSVDSPRPARLEGAETAARALGRDSTPAGGGTGSAERSRAGKLLARGRRDEPLAPPRRGFLESLLTDTDRRTRILETELAPWRMICSLEITAQDGLQYVGTGWLAGPRTVITAGHCVHDPAVLGGWARSVRVTAGRDGSGEPPFGATTTSRYSSVDRWIDAGDPDYDYGAIHLGTDLGAATGWFAVGVLPDDDLRGRLVNVSGYPVEPGNGSEQYFHANRVRAVTGRRLFYDVDTLGGQSGSPIWTYDEGGDTPLVIGIHAYGIGGTPADLRVVANSGPRVLPEVLERIRGWTGGGA